MSSLNFLGETKIDDSNVAIVVDHEVLWLQITVAVAPFVKIAETLDDTGDVEARNGVIEWTLIVEYAPKITAQVSVKEKVDVLLIFEGSVKADDKGRFERHEDVLLVKNMSLLLVLDNTLFLDAFECVRSVFNAFNLDELDDTESTGADWSEHLHVGESASFQGVVHLSRWLVARFGDFFDTLGVAELADETGERVSV